MADRDWTVYDRADLRSGFASHTANGCEVTVALDGLHCAACAARAEKALAGGARDVHVNVATRSLRIRGICADPKGLLPGGFAEVTLQLETVENGFPVPTQAVVPSARAAQ